MAPRRYFATLIACLAAFCGAVLLPLANSSQAQIVWEIPPQRAPAPSQLSSGDVINLRDGGVLSQPFPSAFEPAGYSVPLGVSLNVFGGQIAPHTRLQLGATANLYGGSIGDTFTAQLGSRVFLHGADFAIDGVPIDELNAPGDQAAPVLADGELLTGRLTDGTPFAFSSHDWGIVVDDPYYVPNQPQAPPAGDAFSYGTLTLIQAETLTPVPGELVAAANDLLRFVDDGQSITVEAGGSLGEHFMAGPGSTVTINASPCHGFGCGPSIGDNFEAIGATVTLAAGTVADNVDLFRGSKMTITGGTAGQNLQVHRDATLLVQGGEVLAGLKVMPGGGVTLEGGTISQTTGSSFSPYPTSEAVSVYSGGRLAIAGGVLDSPLLLLPGAEASQSAGVVRGRATLSAGAQYAASGGRIGDLTTAAAAVVVLAGDDFRLNGAPVTELGGVGDLQQIDLPAGAELTGLLEDGRPFVISSQDDSLAAGTLWLERAPASPSGPPLINVPNDPAPAFVTDGQTVAVLSGGQLPSYFGAGRGSAVLVDAGQIGGDAEFAGAAVDVTGGGRLGSQARAYRGATVTVNDGRIGSGFTAYDGSVVDVQQGQILSGFSARAGAQVTVRAGYLGANFNAEAGSDVELTGYDFKLDGVPVIGLANVGDAIGLDVGVGQLLAGVLADGTSFALHSDDGDRVAQGALTLRRVDTPEPGPDAISVPADTAPAGIRAGQTLTLLPGGELADYFVAGDGSRLVVDGGRLRSYAEAINADVVVNAGEVGFGFSAFNSSIVLNGGEFAGTVDLFQGAALTMNGGLIDSTVNVYRGAAIAATGGEIDGSLYVRQDADASIAGAHIAGKVYAYASAEVEIGGRARVEGVSAYSGSHVTLSGGGYEDDINLSTNSTLTLRGSEFRLNGAPVDDLTAVGGKLGELDILTGVFADGTPFAFTERRSFSDSLSSGYIVLEQDAHAAEPGDFTAANLPNPLGVHAGQSVTVSAGQSLGHNFNAGYGSAVHLAGGELGENFEAAGAEVSMTGGRIGDDADLLHHTTLTVTGGTIGDNLLVAPTGVLDLQAGGLGRDATIFGAANIRGGAADRYLTVEAGGVVTMAGGSVADYLRVESNGRLELTGGSVGRYLDLYGDARVTGGVIDRGLDIWSGGTLSVEGGELGTDLNVRSGGSLQVFGGVFADGIEAHSGAAVDLFGAAFTLDGMAIDDLLAPGDSRVMATRQGAVLEVTFADGAREEFTLNASGGSSMDVFSSQALLTLHLVAPELLLAGDFNADGVVDAADYTVWRDHLGQAAGALANDPTNAPIGQPQYEAWRANYGATFGGGAAGTAPVPEPAAMALLLAAATAVGTRRMR